MLENRWIEEPRLLNQLARGFGYPRLRHRVSAVDAEELLEIIARTGTIVQDTGEAPAVRSPDPDDDYLIALAAKCRSVLVSGDSDLQDL